MAFLEKFTAEEKEMLVALPWRVGLWVSAVDDAGDPAAERREVATLEKIITEKSRGMFESAFVHEVMIEIGARRADWKKWDDGLSGVPEACEKAVAAVAARLSPRDVDAYRSNILYIAVAVAKTFREFDLDEPFMTRLLTSVRIALDKLVGIATGQVYESASLLNISYEEDLALARLARALGVGDGSIELQDQQQRT